MLTLTVYANQQVILESRHLKAEAAIARLWKLNEGDRAVILVPNEGGKATFTYQRNALGGWRQTMVVYR